jgi:glycosyltransferase involved in cell wall biosynthesis
VPVASRIAGVVEMIRDGVDGILVDPDDTGDLSRAIIKLIEDPALRRRLAVNAHTRIVRHYDIDQRYCEVEAELAQTIRTYQSRNSFAQR